MKFLLGAFCGLYSDEFSLVNEPPDVNNRLDYLLERFP